MQEKLKEQLLNAFLLVLRPVVRILLRYGIGYREFAEVTKTAFVQVASSDFGLRGRPTNISRVAVMTGLTRKEVRRLRDKIAQGDNTIAVKMTPLADVLHHWHAQAEFTDASGSPVPLPFTGDEKSFTQLVRKFGGDIPAGAMRTEMKRVGVVEEDENGLLTVIERAYQRDDSHDNLISGLVHGAYTLLSNIHHNMEPGAEEGTWANRVAHTSALRTVDSKQLRRITADRIADFSEAIDDVFMAYESLQNGDSADAEGRIVAVGIHYFEESDKDASYDW